MEGIRRSAKTFLAVMTACWAFSPTASAGWRDFVPRPYENGADLDVVASYENENNRSGGGGQSWTDAFVKEKLTLHSDGYVYHPRFVLYRLSFSEAFKHENFESTSYGTTGWKTASGTEYDAELAALPEHPYNLRLFSRRFEPLYKQQFATYSGNVENSTGAIFRYRDKPYFFGARYIKDSIESPQNFSDRRHFGADGTYFKEYADARLLALNASYAHTDFESAFQGAGSTDEYSLGNTINLRAASLTSSVSGAGTRQDDPVGGSLKTDQFTWQERLRAYLPLNFTTDLSYLHSKTDFAADAAGTIPESRVTNVDRRFELVVSHSLYKSLTSQYAFRNDSMSSTDGDTKTVSHSLSMSYVKTIPGGMLLAGLALGRSETDSSGSPAVVNEPHSAVSVPGFFLLNGQNLDPATLRLYLKSPLSPFALVLLEENAHYTVAPFGNTFRITVSNLPSQFAVPGTYELLVSYSIVPADYRLWTDTTGWNVGFDLFNNRVHPYYSYNRSKSEVLSGNFPAAPADTTLHTAGIIFQKEPLRARAEYQRQESNINPYTQWKTEVTCAESITDSIRAFLSSAYTETRYEQGAAAQGGQGYSLRTASVSGNIQEQLPAKNLFLSAGASYSVFRSTTDGSSYSGDAALLWKVGKLSISLGASVAYAKSDSPGAENPETRRSRQYYYLNVKRKLF